MDMNASAAGQKEQIIEETPGELADLCRAIEALPAEHRDALQPQLSRVMDASNRRRRILTLVQEALSQLRLDMKYLVFDLEATRRERDEFRRRLEGNGSND
jgi:nitric oxide reductase activation protein